MESEHGGTCRETRVRVACQPPRIFAQVLQEPFRRKQKRRAGDEKGDGITENLCQMMAEDYFDFAGTEPSNSLIRMCVFMHNPMKKWHSCVVENWTQEMFECVVVSTAVN